MMPGEEPIWTALVLLLLGANGRLAILLLRLRLLIPALLPLLPQLLLILMPRLLMVMALAKLALLRRDGYALALSGPMVTFHYTMPQANVSWISSGES